MRGCPVCEMCGAAVEWDAENGFHFAYGEEGVCGACAERVANLFSIQHSGDPLTWPRSDREAKPRRRAVSAQVRWEVFRAAGFACQKCGETERPLHADHIFPRAKGGGDGRTNLQALCDRCNLKKGAS